MEILNKIVFPSLSFVNEPNFKSVSHFPLIWLQLPKKNFPCEEESFASTFWISEFSHLLYSEEVLSRGYLKLCLYLLRPF